MHGDLVNTIFALVFAIVLIAAVWGLILYAAELGSEEAKREWKGVILGSVSLLFVIMVLFWLVEWIRGAAGL